MQSSDVTINKLIAENDKEEESNNANKEEKFNPKAKQ